MIACFDVHYLADGRAAAAAVLFAAYSDARPAAEYTCLVAAPVADYVPGRFYRRELPCILTLLEQIVVPLEEIIVDGYVMLGDGQPGLGQRLFAAIGGGIAVIGVAKSRFKGASGAEVLRGRSLRPLYVTAAGLAEAQAAERIRGMHGAHRLPTLLKRVDLLAKEKSGA